MKIISYIKSGNSFPVILESNNVRYFVKLRSGMSGQYAIISEWLGNKIGCALELGTQDPCWVNIPEEVQMDGIHQEVKDLIVKSFGLNIGFNFIENIKEVELDDLGEIETKASSNIFLFDIIMLNIDRSFQNTNLIKSDDNLIPIDYESSLLIEGFLHNKKLRDNQAILQKFRNSPLYKKVKEEDLDKFLDKLKSVPIGSILKEIPDDLLMQKEKIEKEFERMNHINWNLRDTIKEIDSLNKETEKELRLRQKINQENFKKNFNERLS